MRKCLSIMIALVLMAVADVQAQTTLKVSDEHEQGRHEGLCHMMGQRTTLNTKVTLKP